MSRELSSYAIRQEGRLVDAMRAIPDSESTDAYTAEIGDALEGIARTFPFEPATRQIAQSIDGLVEHAFQRRGNELTMRGMAWMLPSHSPEPFMITVQVDDARSRALRVGLSIGVRGRDLTTPLTSRELRYLEDALRNDESGVDWAHQDTWQQH